MQLVGELALLIAVVLDPDRLAGRDGGFLVEQASHHTDVFSWAMNDATPLSCMASVDTGAMEKLAAFNSKIGYPDEWRDYSPMEIGREVQATFPARAARLIPRVGE